MNDVDRYVRVLTSVQPSTGTGPRLLARARAVQRFLAGQSIDVIAQESRIGRRYIELWSDAIQQAGLYVGLDPSDCFALATYKNEAECGADQCHEADDVSNLEQPPGPQERRGEKARKDPAL